MPTVSWVVCESSGRWSAALRTALARQAAKHTSRPPYRVHECRDASEFLTTAKHSSQTLGLIEVRPDNLTAVLELLTRSWPQKLRFVALLAPEFDDLTENNSTDAPSGRHTIADVLLEAGALAVITSPRHIHTVLELGKLYSSTHATGPSPKTSLKQLTEQAWNSLPWQP
jgi:hypothetical protein